MNYGSGSLPRRDVIFVVGGDVIAEVLSGPHHGEFVVVSKLHRYHELWDATYRLYFVQGFYYVMKQHDTKNSDT